MIKRSKSQRNAEKRYDSKRKGQPRLPAARLTDQESTLVNQTFEMFRGSKKEAILEGLRLLSIFLENPTLKKK